MQQPCQEPPTCREEVRQTNHGLFDFPIETSAVFGRLCCTKLLMVFMLTKVFIIIYNLKGLGYMNNISKLLLDHQLLYLVTVKSHGNVGIEGVPMHQ